LISISWAICVLAAVRGDFPPPQTSASIADERISPVLRVPPAKSGAKPGARTAKRTRTRDA
jgi:hypothetical protein